jgi:hypothetical protein
MKKDWKYILYLTLAFGIFLAVRLSGPKQFDWTPTYASEDKNPFGAYVLRELIPALFKGHHVQVTNKTLYELRDSLKPGQNVLILTHSYSADAQDVTVLLDHVNAGGSAFIGAESFHGKLADTLELSTQDYLFQRGMYSHRKDTSFLKFMNTELDTAVHYVFRRDNIHNYFEAPDTSKANVNHPGKRNPADLQHAALMLKNTTVIAENDMGKPVLVNARWGKGNFIICSTPLAFTNIYALKDEHHNFVSNALSYLPQGDVCWSEYYSIGRLESQTPLRFILTHEPLAWAYYMSVIALLLFMAFESKRKQRIIPTINPLTNSSLEFVSTIGNLYFSRGDHKNIVDKKILFFWDYVRTKYSINPAGTGENFISLLSKKSGKNEEQVRMLFGLVRSLQTQTSISESDLRLLNDEMENFMRNEFKKI